MLETPSIQKYRKVKIFWCGQSAGKVVGQKMVRGGMIRCVIVVTFIVGLNPVGLPVKTGTGNESSDFMTERPIIRPLWRVNRNVFFGDSPHHLLANKTLRDYMPNSSFLDRNWEEDIVRSA